MNRRALISLAALAVVAGAAGFGTYRWLQPPPPAPDLDFTDLDGKGHKLSDYRGTLTLVNFWASWCAPCLHELPLLVQAQTRLAGRLQILGPALDAPGPVRDMITRFGINYPVFVGDNEVTYALEQLGDAAGVLPFSVLIGADGRILDRAFGGLTQEKLDALIGKHLAH